MELDTTRFHRFGDSSMTSPISFSGGLPPLPPLARLPPATSGLGSATLGRGAGNVNFQDVLLKSIEQVNEVDRHSQSMIAGAITGEEYTQAEIFTAVKKADLALRTMLQIRNKLLEAYN
jgi:flagellar hook-basal body complex protein FliE